MSMDGIRNLEEERQDHVAGLWADPVPGFGDGVGYGDGWGTMRIIEPIAGGRAAFASTARSGRADRNV
jgi:hypothetical protein